MRAAPSTLYDHFYDKFHSSEQTLKAAQNVAGFDLPAWTNIRLRTPKRIPWDFSKIVSGDIGAITLPGPTPLFGAVLDRKMKTGGGFDFTGTIISMDITWWEGYLARDQKIQDWPWICAAADPKFWGEGPHDTDPELVELAQVDTQFWWDGRFYRCTLAQQYLVPDGRVWHAGTRVEVIYPDTKVFSLFSPECNGDNRDRHNSDGHCDNIQVKFFEPEGRMARYRWGEKMPCDKTTMSGLPPPLARSATFPTDDPIIGVRSATSPTCHPAR